MSLFEGKTPAERNKMIAAIVLPLLALASVLYMLFFSSGPAPRQAAGTDRRSQSAGQRAQRAQADAARAAEEEAFRAATPVVYERGAPPGGGTGRNIFAFSSGQAGPARPSAGAEGLLENLPTPTPTPPPPLVLAGLAPQSVFARTGEFTMQVSGDKFTPQTRVYIDGQEQPTQFRSSQQLTATVGAALLSSPGSRTVVARTPDNLLYSNATILSVMQPPAPTVTYVGLLSRKRFDTAVLREQDGNLLNVRKGDLIERGRFRVTEISDRSVEVVDKDLDIKHVLPFVETRATAAPIGRGPMPGSFQTPQSLQVPQIQTPTVVQPVPTPQPQKEKEDGDDEP